MGRYPGSKAEREESHGPRRIDGPTESLVLDAKIRSAYDQMMRPIGGALARNGLDPNVITLVGVALQIVVGAAILSGRLFLAGLLAVVAALADTLDGAVAKARGITSKWGALLDSTVDRLSDALFFLPLAWLYGVAPTPGQAGQRYVAAVALVTLVASFLVSYVKARAEGLGFSCNVGLVERAERVMIIVLGLLLDVVPLALLVLGALSLITLAQRLLYVRTQARSAV